MECKWALSYEHHRTLLTSTAVIYFGNCEMLHLHNHKPGRDVWLSVLRNGLLRLVNYSITLRNSHDDWFQMYGCAGIGPQPQLRIKLAFGSLLLTTWPMKEWNWVRGVREGKEASPLD